MPGFKKTMGEFAKGTLRSGSKSGPVVTDPKMAKAIAYSELRRGKKKRKAKKARRIGDAIGEEMGEMKGMKDERET